MSMTQGSRTAHSCRRCKRVIIADGHNGRNSSLADALNEWGYETIVVSNHQRLLDELAAEPQALVLLDCKLCSTDEMVLYGQLLLDGFAPKVIPLGDDSRLEIVQRAAGMGALGFLDRSESVERARKTLENVINTTVNPVISGLPLLGNSSAVKELRNVIRHVAASDDPVMISGESGSGKEMVARTIHDCSSRAANDFVSVNMGVLSGDLLDRVLLGKEERALSGANAPGLGLCRDVPGRTLFLDEIGETSRDLQPGLLRFLQDRSVDRSVDCMGSLQDKRANTRIISATNRTIGELLGSGLLRDDLCFRLCVIPITVPPLRERVDDIPLLASTLLQRKCSQVRRQLSFSSEAIDLLCQYKWPGNIRQLENFIARMVVLTKGNLIEAEALPGELSSGCFHGQGLAAARKLSDADVEDRIIINDRQLTRMECAERKLIIEALRRHGGIVSHAARFLGLGPATVYRKIRSLGIPKADVGRDME